MYYNHRHLYWCNAIDRYCRCVDQGSISGGEYGLHQHSGTGQDRYADQRVGNAVMIMMMIDDGDHDHGDDDDGDDDLNSRMIVMIYWCQLNNDYDDDDDDSVSFISSTILIILHESL